MPLPPAGWMPDPSVPGLERYWDGSRWSVHTRDGRGDVTGAPAAPWVSRASSMSGASSYATARTYAPAPVHPALPPRRRRRPGRTLRWMVVLALMAAALVVFDTPASRTLREMGVVPASVPVVHLTPDRGWAVPAAPFEAPADPLAGAWGDTGESVPDAPPPTADVDYPLVGSTELVRHLEAAMIARQESIDVAAWGGAPGAREALNDAMQEALTQSAYIFVDRWQVSFLGNRAVTIEPSYLYDENEMRTRQRATAAAVASALGVLDLDGLAPAEKALAIHHYVAERATYDYGAADRILEGATGIEVAESQEAHGILVSGTAVCNGYAQAFRVMADAAGLDVVTVTGDATDGFTSGGHAWNRVLIDGEWLLVDVTWDDGGDYAPVPRDYFLVAAGDPVRAGHVPGDDWVVPESRGVFGG